MTKYFNQIIAAPFYSSKTESPIGIFQIDLTGNAFSTSVDIVEPLGNDIEAGGQAQEYITDRDADLKAFYEKWDHMHLKNFSAFNFKQFEDLEHDIDEIVEHHAPLVANYEPDLEVEIGIWSGYFQEEANKLYSNMIHDLQQAKERLGAEDPDGVIDGIGGLASFWESLQEYGIVDDDYTEEFIQNQANEDAFSIKDVVDDLDSSMHWHYIDGNIIEDSDLEDQLNAWLDDQISACQKYLD